MIKNSKWFLYSLTILARFIYSTEPDNLISESEIGILLDHPNGQYVYLDNEIRNSLALLSKEYKNYVWSPEFNQLLEHIKVGQTIALEQPINQVVDECLYVMNAQINASEPSDEIKRLKNKIENYKQELTNGNALIRAKSLNDCGKSKVEVFCNLLVQNCLRVCGTAFICNGIIQGNLTVGGNLAVDGTISGGINGQPVDQNVAVLVGTDGKLGTVPPSSVRYKKDIESLGDLTNDLINLRPVKFRYKEEVNASRDIQYGLIAEEVAEVYPEMVTYKNEQPESVKYNLLNILLLNEVKKLMIKQREQEQKILELIAREGEKKINKIEAPN